jgi:hypothetical protein
LPDQIGKKVERYFDKHSLIYLITQTVLIYTVCGGGDDDGDEVDDEGGDVRGWVLVTRLMVGAPVLSVAHEDVMGDGVKRLLVLTAQGLQIFAVRANSFIEMLKGLFMCIDIFIYFYLRILQGNSNVFLS